MRLLRRVEHRLGNAGVARSEVIVLIVMVLCLVTILVPVWLDRRRGAAVAEATSRLNTIYDSEVVQFFSLGYFRYSATATKSRPDFSAPFPPAGKAEELIGFTGSGRRIARRGKRKVELEPLLSKWETIGFPLTRPSYYVYRIEPAEQYRALAKVNEWQARSLTFQTGAFGDLDGDGRPSILVRAGYVDKQGFYVGMKRIAVADLLE